MIPSPEYPPKADDWSSGPNSGDGIIPPEIHPEIQGVGRLEETLQKALRRIETLLKDAFPDSDEIHKTKSLLYAAIERTGMKAERLLSLQRMLRELFALVAQSGDFRPHERRMASLLLRDLWDRYGEELGFRVEISNFVPHAAVERSPKSGILF